MATQMQVAHSSFYMGAGLFAGIPYWCAQGILGTALSSCMKVPFLIYVPTLTSAVHYSYSTGSIENPTYMKNQRLYVFHGTEDATVYPGVGQKLVEFYADFIPASNTKLNMTIPAAHAQPTNNYGNRCSYTGSPYINNCNYDATGDMFSWIYHTEPMRTKVPMVPENLVQVDQAQFVPPPYTASGISMARTAYAYIPNGCKNFDNACRLHVALHGCQQNTDYVGLDYVKFAGYNEWAEANNIIILYPQTISSLLFPNNPQGCWDWWGYNSLNYATMFAPQTVTIQNMVNSFNLVSLQGK